MTSIIQESIIHFFQTESSALYVYLNWLIKSIQVRISGDTTMGVPGEIDRPSLRTSAIHIINGILHNINLQLHLHQQWWDKKHSYAYSYANKAILERLALVL